MSRLTAAHEALTRAAASVRLRASAALDDVARARLLRSDLVTHDEPAPEVGLSFHENDGGELGLRVTLVDEHEVERHGFVFLSRDMWEALGDCAPWHGEAFETAVALLLAKGCDIIGKHGFVLPDFTDGELSCDEGATGFVRNELKGDADGRTVPHRLLRYVFTLRECIVAYGPDSTEILSSLLCPHGTPDGPTYEEAVAKALEEGCAVEGRRAFVAGEPSNRSPEEMVFGVLRHGDEEEDSASPSATEAARAFVAIEREGRG